MKKFVKGILITAFIVGVAVLVAKVFAPEFFENTVMVAFNSLKK